MIPASPYCDICVTTDDLRTGQPAATPAASGRRVLRPLLLVLLAMPSLPLLAAPEPAEIVPEAIAAPATEVVMAEGVPAAGPEVTANAAAPAAARATPTSGTLRQKADAAADATLAALLPHISGNDSLPLLDRSAMFAGDVSRLLSAYDLTQGAAAAPPSEGRVQQVLKAAMSLIGTPYRWGGTSTEGFDCSGLVGYVFRSALGIELPRVSREMAAKADAQLIRDRNQLNPGDLVFFGLRGRVNHVGIYVGNGQFLHAPSRGKDVRVDSLTSGYWGNRFMQARRVEI
ncbi:C40 family peptidase [Pseudoxanthomonas suwonensis]|uniref:C40 family peptidase n=1 Tax=Pseudoxanthomonas suwonensis TaxID=314722 RepID=UPI0009DF3515